LGSNISLSTLFSDTLSRFSSVNLRDRSETHAKVQVKL
jgi:hypothetical protein